GFPRSSNTFYTLCIVTPRQQGPVPVQARRARVVFEAAIKRRPSERIAYIDGACLADEALRAQVMYLLDTSESDASYAAPPILPQITSDRPVELEPPTRIVVAKVEEAVPPLAKPQSEEALKQAPAASPEFDDEKTRIA